MKKQKKCTYSKEPVSPIRKAYFARLVLRVLLLIGTILLYIFRPDDFSVLEEFLKKYIKNFDKSVLFESKKKLGIYDKLLKKLYFARR